MARRQRNRYKKWDILMVECCDCGEMKPSTDYHKSSRGLFWLNNVCVTCRKAAYQKDKEKISQERKEYYQRIKEAKKEYQRNYYYQNDKHIREQHKDYRAKDIGKIKQQREQHYKKNRDKILEDRENYVDKRDEELWFSRGTFHAKARRQIEHYNLKPLECMICWNSGRIVAHHPSYESFDKWKDVVFVCDSCHQNIHHWFLECPEPIDLIQYRAHMPELLTDTDL